MKTSSIVALLTSAADTVVTRVVTRAVVGLAALTLAACSDDAAPASGSAGFDLAAVRACELLSSGEIEAATGIAVAEGQDVSRVGGQLPMCNWLRAGSDADVVLSLLITHSAYADFDAFVASSRESAFGDVLGDADVEEIAGVGRFGVWMPEAMMFQAFGDRALVQTQVMVAPGRDTLEAAKTLAGTALANVR